ncbi:hypothetical protein SUGI_0203000 [Cryptomeria japonica]|nr:hypothetical protein SUGI_0203000 [Cryptomeria japonica]
MNSRRKIARVSIFLSPIQLGFYSSSVLHSSAVKTSSRQMSPSLLRNPAYRERKYQIQPRIAFALVVYSNIFRCTNMALAKHFTSASNLEITELGFGEGRNKNKEEVDGYQTMNSGLNGKKIDDGLRSDRSVENEASVLHRTFMINHKDPNPYPGTSTSIYDVTMELGLGKMDEDNLISSGVAGSENSEVGGNLNPDWTPSANNAAVKPKRTLLPNPKSGFGKMDEDELMCPGLGNNKLVNSLNSDQPTTNSVSVPKRVIETSSYCSHKPHANPSSAGLVVSEDMVLQVFSFLKNDWNSAMFFFSWANKQPGYRHGTEAYNAMLDILGKHKCFVTMWKLVFEMHKHNPSLVTDETFSIVIRRYASAHMVERAIETFYRRTEFGLKLNAPAFQVLLDALCKARHVQEAEALFNLKQKEFKPVMKSRNIILNGWCGFPNLREAKRFWDEMSKKGCKPNLITYSTYISALAKKSKLNTALTLFGQMWDKGCIPDVPLCNAILDALCLKKGIPAALDVFVEMNEHGCLPDAVTYNTLIKHICDAGSVDKAYELLDEMQRRGCTPNVRTYHYFFRAATTPEKALKVFQRMVKTGCMLTSDTYNLLLKMLLGWNEIDKVLVLWDDMEKSGMGPDQRSYTVMVHSLHEKGKFNEAYRYYNEMRAKGFLPEPKTKLLSKRDNFLTTDQAPKGDLK